MKTKGDPEIYQVGDWVRYYSTSARVITHLGRIVNIHRNKEGYAVSYDLRSATMNCDNVHVSLIVEKQVENYG